MGSAAIAMAHAAMALAVINNGRDAKAAGTVSAINAKAAGTLFVKATVTLTAHAEMTLSTEATVTLDMANTAMALAVISNGRDAKAAVTVSVKAAINTKATVTVTAHADMTLSTEDALIPAAKELWQLLLLLIPLFAFTFHNVPNPPSAPSTGFINQPV